MNDKINTEQPLISEDYCSYEVAKLLKEKGFDELTNLVWYQHLPTSLDCRNLVNKKARDYFYHNETTEHNSSYKNSKHKPEYIHGDIFSCPTHQLAMKWLRERHIIIVIAPAYFNSEQCASWDIDIWVDGDYNHPFEDYPTYEEAVEAALHWTLENLL